MEESDSIRTLKHTTVMHTGQAAFMSHVINSNNMSNDVPAVLSASCQRDGTRELLVTVEAQNSLFVAA